MATTPRPTFISACKQCPARLRLIRRGILVVTNGAPRDPCDGNLCPYGHTFP